MTARTDKPIEAPELKGYERAAPSGRVPVAMAVKPAEASMSMPEALKPLPRADADYRATAPFPNYFRDMIDRLAPVAGVLDYDKDGRVLDLKGTAR